MISKEQSGRSNTSPDHRLPGRQADNYGKIKIAILIPLLLVMNIIVATMAWFAVGAFLR
jgi:hypothetical protein